MSPNHPIITLPIEGMTCTSCASGIERHLKKIGLSKINVDFATSSAHFTETAEIDSKKVISEINSLGYKAVPINKSGSWFASHSIDLKFITALIFTIPLLLHMFFSWEWLHNDLVQLTLALPVFLIGLHHFGRSALASLRIGVPNMDVLIIIGATAAFVYSLIGTIFNLGPNYLFYETSASIITIVLFGNLLERLSVRKASSAIDELTKLQKVTANRILADGSTEAVDSRSLEVGDQVLVNTGDKVPADGESIWGEALIDESMMTGESVPVARSPGDKVIGGSLVAGGSLKVRITAVRESTYLAHMIDLVRQAQSNRPRIQRLADKISAVFVPAVLSIAALTFLISYLAFGVPVSSALLRSIAVLVIACPCAMGLATPAAVMVGIGRAVKAGMLIKDSRTLEKLAEVTTIVFDKTGTLTTGSFEINGLQTFGESKEEVESILYSIERHSSHPLAKSITARLSHAAVINFTEIQEKKGVGVFAKDESGNTYAAGSYELAKELTEDDSHNVYILKNKTLIGWANLDDQPKEESVELVSKLHSLGLTTVILSGDSEERARLIAERLGIERVYAQKTPEEKLQIIDDLQADGKMAAFVGDGINDAPALSKAAVGISISEASQAAIESAQVILVGGRIGQIYDVIVISRKTLRTIKENLFWAFFYNVCAIPVAALGYLAPTVAAFTMAFSDVVIIFNSLRLKTFHIKK